MFKLIIFVLFLSHLTSFSLAYQFHIPTQFLYANIEHKNITGARHSTNLGDYSSYCIKFNVTEDNDNCLSKTEYGNVYHNSYNSTLVICKSPTKDVITNSCSGSGIYKYQTDWKLNNCFGKWIKLSVYSDERCKQSKYIFID